MTADEAAALIGSDYPVRQPVLQDCPPVDARAMVAISGIPISTLNVWVNRGLFPWAESATPGRARLFNIDFAMHLAITGFLVRLGLSAAVASNEALGIMQQDLGRPALKAIIGPIGGPTGMFTSAAPRELKVIQAEVLGEAELVHGSIVLDVSWLMHRLIEAANAVEEQGEQR
jgi:hypothetical protein